MTYVASPQAVAFVTFHDANPHVYEAMVRYARELKSMGKDKIGVEIIMGRVRWDYTVSTTDSGEYKISNNHKPFYARLIMYQCRDLRGFFDTKSTDVSGADEFIEQLRIADGHRFD